MTRDHCIGEPMTRRRLFIANWKMNKTNEEALSFFNEFQPLLPEKRTSDIVICPPFTSIGTLIWASKGKIGVGAQNLFWEEKGAYTGEISPSMLKALGCSHVILGHSERRHIFGESEEWIHKKVTAAHKTGLIPVLCIGETPAQMEMGKTLEAVENQLRSALAGLSVTQDNLVVAYEPVWAIGTGKADSPVQSNQTIGAIRAALKTLTNDFDAIRILYGGSVNPDNIASFMACPEIDGALVGGASLNPQSFAKIVVG